MPLTEYKKKRDFKRTSEPAGRLAKKRQTRIFVIQKHAASHLHYDFRLEIDGVLKSWAVPKEPSADPKIRRLAIMVEDHPLEYAKFHGTIPEGNYGAGKVEIWDKGRYSVADAEDQEAVMKSGLRKGALAFELKGKKLKGTYHLIRLSRPGQKNAWLLFKGKI